MRQVVGKATEAVNFTVLVLGLHFPPLLPLLIINPDCTAWAGSYSMAGRISFQYLYIWWAFSTTLGVL